MLLGSAITPRFATAADKPLLFPRCLLHLFALPGVMAATDYPLLDGTNAGGLKLTQNGLERSRYRHEPYARYSTKVVT